MKMPGISARIVFAGILLSIGLIGAAVAHVLAVASGTEIILPAQGYDPRSMLSGHYTQVRYAIGSAVQLPRIPMSDPHGKAAVWVVIAPASDDWAVVAISRQRPPLPPAGSYLVRATATLLYVATSEDVANYDLLYGIERIYAQQSEAQALDKLIRTRVESGEEPHVKVVTALGGDGRLRIKGIIAEGARRDFTWW